MAANMQQMAAQGMPAQMRKQGSNQLQNYVYQSVMRNTPAANPMAWQSQVQISERMNKIMQLVTNALLSHPNNHEQMKIAEFCCSFERETFLKAPNKDSYEQSMHSKTQEFFKKRQANEQMLQSSLQANAQAQAQAQAMMNMNMQAQMGRGMMPNQQQTFQQQVQQQMQQMQQQQLQQQRQQQQQQSQQQQPQAQQQMGMGMGMNNGGMNLGAGVNMANMNMGNQAGRGTTPNQQQMMMAMQNGSNIAGAPFSDISKLANGDRVKVLELAAKMMQGATEESKQTARAGLQQKLTPQQYTELQAGGRDPALYAYQQHALNVLKMNIAKLQEQHRQRYQQQQQQQQRQQQQPGQVQNQNAAQAPMMQQQASQQRQNMANDTQQQQAAAGADFNGFNPSMESIKDQQMNGLRAQKAGQMVVPASGAGRPTSQPMAQSASNQQNATQNQTPRMPQHQQPQGQGQQGQGMNAQQMKMNQAAQQTQAQLQAQAQMKQMQGQQASMGNPMGPSQSPAMGTLNTPGARPPNGMNQMGGQGMGQGNAAFGDQRFNQGTQRPNSQIFQAMMSQMSPEQRQQMTSLPPDKITEAMRRWQQQRQEAMGMVGGTDGMQGQMPNRPPSQMGQVPQMGQMKPNAGPQGAQGMQQPGVAPNQAQMRMPGQAQAIMDQMEVPPSVLAGVSGVPPEVKKWKDLKAWAAQANAPHQMRVQLQSFQAKQFQMWMQQKRMQVQNQNGQNMAMNQGTPGAGGQMPNMQPGQPQMQAQLHQQQQQPVPQPQPGMQASGVGQYPPNIDKISVQDLANVRSSKPGLANNKTDDQLRGFIIQMRRQAWDNQQAMRAQQVQGQMQGMNATQLAQARMQQQQMAQTQQGLQAQAQRAPNPLGPNAGLQVPYNKPQAVSPDQANINRPNSRAQAPQGTPVNPAAKNLKRPSADDAIDAAGNAQANPQLNAALRQQQQQQQQQQNMKTMQNLLALTPQELGKLPPDQRAKVEQFRKMQMAAAGKGSMMPQQAQATNENLARLKALGHEAQIQVSQQAMPDIPMSPDEYEKTAKWLQQVVGDMSKIGRGLTRWYALTRDDERAREFFKIRMRIIRQHADGEGLKVLKEVFSMRSAELGEARSVLEKMAKDLAASVYQRGMVKMQQAQANAQMQTQGPGQQQMPQMPQDQQSTPPTAQPPNQTPLNAANLEKNSQALKAEKTAAGKSVKQSPGATNGSQPPGAPTTAQPPFSFGAASPHGHPNYIGKPTAMNLQLPTSRKKPKTSGPEGQTPQGSSQSPQLGRLGPTQEGQKAPEPPRPVLVCRESGCEESIRGYANANALQKHMEEEHVQPAEDPIQFVQDHLVLALGLEPDGSLKKESPAGGMIAAAAMSATTSKEGQTPAQGSQKSTLKVPSVAQPYVSELDAWAGATIDPQALRNNLGLGNGIPGIISDINVYRSLTPEDTPDSSKDSGASEPNSDISDGVALEIGVDFQHFDNDLMFDMGNASLADLDGLLDPAVLMDAPSKALPDWDDINIDFTKPFQLDTSFYSMAT